LTSYSLDLLISLSRDGTRSLAAQIEEELRCAIRLGKLKAGTLIPSTRDLARQLGISRPLVVDAYAQLAAEGYLAIRHGARPRVSDCIVVKPAKTAEAVPVAPPPRYDFLPTFPDLSAFPRERWLKAYRAALTRMASDDLGYRDRHGSVVLRRALADYLGRGRARSDRDDKRL
jgi:GntR family transcriptional regulator/MocR family aminotransferase